MDRNIVILVLLAIGIYLVGGVALPAVTDTFVKTAELESKTTNERLVTMAEVQKREADTSVLNAQATLVYEQAANEMLRARAEATRISAEADAIRQTSLSTAEALRRQREMDNGLGANMNARIAENNPITDYEGNQAKIVATSQASAIATLQAAQSSAASAQSTADFFGQLLLYAVIILAVLIMLRK